MKKTISLLLALISIFLLVQPAIAATPDAVVPLYANASSANVKLNIVSSGAASVTIYCNAYNTLRSAAVTIYIEKKVGSSWVRVDIGTTNDTWQYATTNCNIHQTYSTALSGSGTYRAVAQFRLSASTVETFSKTSTASF